jgi:myo-inositol-1(or 4)-monophosphatase
MKNQSTRFVTRSATVNVMARAIEKACKGLVRDFNEVEHLQVSQKGPGDFVSTADLRVEKTLRMELEKARPTYGFIMEEGGVVKGEDPHNDWVIDPIDGTSNFLHGIPHFAVTVALKRDKEIIAGCTYDPIKDEFFWAEKGLGAYLNDRRIRVSTRKNLNECLLVTGFPFAGHGDSKAFNEVLGRVMPQVAGVRRFGSAALDMAYVAAGRFEGYWEADINPWDIAAGIILVKEAGGHVRDLEGGHDMLTKKTILASPEHLHAKLMDIIKG